MKNDKKGIISEVFKHETTFLETSNRILQEQTLTETELWEEYTKLNQFYRKLLNDSIKITMIGDKHQRKALIANEALKESEQKLRKINQELEELNREKSEFLGIVSHDLKNPLSIILGVTQLIEHMGLENYSREDILRFFDTVEKTAKRMFELVNNLLDINRFESGKMNLTPGIFDLRFPLTETLANYMQRADEKNIKINYPLPEEDVPVYADEASVNQVFENLISNAIKYSPPGKNIYIRLSTTEEEVRCEIQDEGLGLTDDDKKKVFGKFARLSAKPTAGEHSTGLGLSIVKKLVEAMDGRVWVESDGKDQGSTFIVVLPAQKPFLEDE